MLGTSPVRLLEERVYLGAGLWHRLPCCQAGRVRMAVRFFVFLFSSCCVLEWGRSRKEKETKQGPKNTVGQEAFLEMARIGPVS